MIEYTATFVRGIVENLEPVQIEAPTEEALWSAVETLEGLEGILIRLPASERREALSNAAIQRAGVLWLPTVRNCRLSVGVAVEGDGFVFFAVGDESSADEVLANYFSARTAVAHALHVPKERNTKTESANTGESLSFSAGLPTDGHDSSLVEAIKESGWAMPAGRRADDLDPELLARITRLSEEGIVHLFAEGGGVVLAMAGSTVGDRKRAVERLPNSPARPLDSRRVFGVLLEVGEAGTHYSEEEGWGLTGKAGKTAPGAELEAAAACFRKSRGGSLAVAGTKAERRRIEANRRRLRAEFIARRRRGDELIVRSARDSDASRKESRESCWTEAPVFRRRVEARRNSGRAAYDTARAVYVRRLPTLAHRLLHLLRREGRAVRERDFVSRHANLVGARALEPEAAPRSALRDLADAGKVRRLKSRRTGEVFLAATEPLDKEAFRRSLNGLIRDDRFGILNPWAETDAVEPDEGEEEEALLESDFEGISPEETGHEALLDRVADESAQEEIEGLTA